MDPGHFDMIKTMESALIPRLTFSTPWTYFVKSRPLVKLSTRLIDSIYRACVK